MSTENYKKGASYEGFLRRAHKLRERNSRQGAESAIFTNLLDAEEGNRHSFLPSYDKQFEKVKGYLEKGCNAFLKNRKLTIVDKEKINDLKNRFNKVRSAKEMVSLIEEGIEITQPYKEF